MTILLINIESYMVKKGQNRVFCIVIYCKVTMTHCELKVIIKPFGIYEGQSKITES